MSTITERASNLRELSARQREVLASLTPDWQTPMYLGGTDGSDHSRVLASLARLGLAERQKRHAMWCYHGTLHEGRGGEGLLLARKLCVPTSGERRSQRMTDKVLKIEPHELQPAPVSPLLSIAFPRGRCVRYMSDFSIEFVGGPWWAREVGLAYQMIGEYRAFDKEYHPRSEKGISDGR